MAKRRKRMGVTADRPEKVYTVVDLNCSKQTRKILQFSLRSSRPRTTCHDIVVECAGSGYERHDRLAVRAVCTTPKSKEAFVDMVHGYAKSIKGILE